MNRKTSQIGKKATLAAISILLLFAAGPVQAKTKKLAAPGMPVQLVWPLPPEKPRIKFVASIYGAANVEGTRKANFLDRLAGIQRANFKPYFAKPFGIATDSRNHIYVSDSVQGVIFVLDRENRKVTYVGPGSRVNLAVPLGIAVDSKDRLWVADAAGQHVYVFDSEGNALMSLGGAPEMTNPTDVALDEARHRAYVTDSVGQRILVYDSETGQPIAKFGKRGSGNGQFNFPSFVAVDGRGNIYVSDTLNFRVQVFDPQYRFVQTFGKQGNQFGQFSRPKGIAFDSYQNLYVVDSDFCNFQIFDPKEQLLMFLGGWGPMPGHFALPAGIAIDKQNFIYVTDQSNHRIQIFQLLNGTADTPAPSATGKTAASQIETKGSGASVTVGSVPQSSFTENPKEKTTP
jgi:DNA-binding beta-propeller fold protein YncE